MNLLLLAAGLGTRFRPLTLKYPKPSIPFLNVPIGLYPLRFLQRLNLEKIVVNTHHKPEQIRSMYSKVWPKEILSFSDESGKILGSAGGLKNAQPFFNPKQTILMANADEVFFTENDEFLQQAYAEHKQENRLATLVVMKHPEAGKKFGAIWTNGARVVQIGKNYESLNLTPWHYIGMMFVEPDLLDSISEDVETNIFYDILVQKLAHQNVGFFELACEWFETGNFADYFAATKYCLQNYNSKIQQFIESYDKSVIIRSETGVSLVSEKLRNEIKDSDLSGFNVISETVKQLRHASYQNSILFDDEILNESYFT